MSPSPEDLEAMMRKLLDSQDQAELRVGFVHQAMLHKEYGRVGVVLPVSLLDVDGDVTTTLVWVAPEGVPMLRRVLKQLNSPEFLRQIPDPSLSLRTPPSRPARSGKRRKGPSR